MAIVALIKDDGRSGGMVFFIDSDKACTPIRFPRGSLDHGRCGDG